VAPQDHGFRARLIAQALVSDLLFFCNDLFTRNTAKVALSTLFTRIEQSWRLYSSVEFVRPCIARSSSVPETCNYSQGEFSAIAPMPLRNARLRETRRDPARHGCFER